MSVDENETVSQVWSDFAHARLAPGTEGWRFALDHPRVRAYVYDTYIGGMDPFGWALSTLAPSRSLRALEIGCGGGDLAIGLAKCGRFSHIDALDVSTGAVELGRRKALAAGVSNVNFKAQNCNDLQLGSVKYDFVYSSHALHHIEGLEDLFRQIEEVLEDDGIFFADDYVGPSRMQYSDEHVELINDVFKHLPEEKRQDAWFNDVIKTHVQRTPVEEYIRIDPSEGVRADEIVSVMSAYLETETYPLGMKIAYETLTGVIRNFDPGDAQDNALLDKIIDADRIAARDPRIPVCFAMLVGRKRVLS